jgi:hypothetical protein
MLHLEATDLKMIAQLLSFWTLGTNSFDWAQSIKFHLKMKMESSLQNAVSLNIHMTMDHVQKQQL